MVSVLKYSQFINEMVDWWWDRHNSKKLKYKLDDIVIFKGYKSKIIGIVPSSVNPYQIHFIKNGSVFKHWAKEDEITIDKTIEEKEKIDDRIRWWRNGKLEESSENLLEIDLYDLIKKLGNVLKVYEYLQKNILTEYNIIGYSVKDYKVICREINIDNNCKILWFNRDPGYRGGYMKNGYYTSDILKIKNFILYFKKQSKRILTKEDPYGEENWDY